MNWVWTTLGLAAALGAAPTEPQPAAGTIRVLLVTGVDYAGHLWQQTTPALVELLKHDPRIQVTVTDKPGQLASEEIFAYDVLLLHFKNYDPLPQQEKAEANLVKYVQGGKGLALIHFACGAFEDWPEFADLAGRVWDRKTGHDPRGPFVVKIAEPDHPVTQGLKDFQTDDELYTCLVGQRQIRILATARSKLTGKDHPMAFVFQYGKGRVFHTPLGHDVKAIKMPGFGELLRRGVAWAAGQPPVP
ncbi:MAG: ThuA domain-containing protein [Thermoguttaceae bacterium]